MPAAARGRLDRPESVVLLQDVYDHSLRIADLIESQRDLLTGLLEAHLAVVSNRMNDVMKKTSSYGAILLVSTLIAGIYGMNFRYMPGAAACTTATSTRSG